MGMSEDIERVSVGKDSLISLSRFCRLDDAEVISHAAGSRFGVGLMTTANRKNFSG